jgi:dTDP-4-amino-4,6-dideoxygalactose transaminase
MTNIAVRFRDLSVGDAERRELLSSIDRVMRVGQFILGEDVEQFEREFARRCHQDYCVGVSNGTAALYLALRAFGVGPGDEVITSAMSWVATGNAITALGAAPVFVDVRNDYNIDPSAIESAFTSKTRAVVPVHFYGRISSMARICEFAAKTSVPVVEDAAQAFGALVGDQPAGSFGDAAAFSLNPMKPLAALGEAGAIVTRRHDIAEKIRSLRYLGTVDRETCVDPSLNFKIDTLQAVVLLERMKRVEQSIAHRNRIAETYSAGLEDLVTVPEAPSGGRSAFFDYTIFTESRDSLEAFLLSRGIEVKVRHRLLLTQQPGYVQGETFDTPNARRLVNGILSLPIHEAMEEEQVELVVSEIRRFFVTNS